MTERLTKEEIISCLQGDEEETQALFAAARRAREETFRDRIFLYAFVYFSTWCRNNCAFCYFRESNPISRYRKSKEEIRAYVQQLCESGVHLIDLTMGEDANAHEAVFEIIEEIKSQWDIPIMISPGVVDANVMKRLAELGTDWYALYQETHNRGLFQKLRIDQDYDERMNCKRYARESGMLFEEGLLSGVGESVEDIAESLLTMGRIGASQMRVMSFVPQEGSPMETVKTPDRNRELKIIALLRILYPYALIPASLDVDGIKGLRSRIDAGANVVTSIIPPRSGLMGVAQSKMDVDEGGRTAGEVRAILRDMGLTAAELWEYKSYLEVLRRRKQDDSDLSVNGVLRSG